MPSDDAFLVMAAALAHEIADAAAWHEGRCNWVGAQPGDESRPLGSRRIHAALGPDLYDGTSGVALFLAEAGARLDDRRLRDTALGAVRHAVAHAGRIAPELRDGLYAGQIGVAYAAARTGSEEALAGARDVLEAWRRGRGNPAAADVFGGCAGAVAGLVALTEWIDEPWLLDTATEIGDVVITRARGAPAGWSWPDAADAANHHLCGYSHGAAGIGHALLELFGATGEERFREAGERAFEYEQWWFDRRLATWPDLRGVARAAGWDVPAPAAGSWCHGAPGITLSRLRAEQLGSHRRDADPGLAITRALARPPDDFSLCHGAAGIADVLLYAASSRRDSAPAAVAAGIGQLGIERHGMTGFPCGLPDGRTPGLFLGLAGIGLLYLRLSDPGVATPLIVHCLDTRSAPSVESSLEPESEESRARARPPA